MVRTQIYLTEEEQQALRVLARRTGRSQSELIREAVDALIARMQRPERAELLERARGMWRDREDLGELVRLRRELDRQVADAS